MSFTNGDRIRAMTDEELAEYLAWGIIPTTYDCSCLGAKEKSKNEAEIILYLQSGAEAKPTIKDTVELPKPKFALNQKCVFLDKETGEKSPGRIVAIGEGVLFDYSNGYTDEYSTIKIDPKYNPKWWYTLRFENGLSWHSREDRLEAGEDIGDDSRIYLVDEF